MGYKFANRLVQYSSTYISIPNIANIAYMTQMRDFFQFLHSFVGGLIRKNDSKDGVTSLLILSQFQCLLNSNVFIKLAFFPLFPLHCTQLSGSPFITLSTALKDFVRPSILCGKWERAF